MSLNWNVSGIENHDEICWFTADADYPDHGMEKGKQYLAPLTNAFIWHSLNTGIGTITEANAAEVFARISFVESLYGASLRKDGKDRPITIEDVQAHVGLYTNASFKDESRASFLKRHAASQLDQSKRSYERKIEQAQAAA
jgi:hypothetical protein